MAGGGSTGGIGAQNPASGGFGGGFGGQPQFSGQTPGQMTAGFGGTAENGYMSPGGSNSFGGGFDGGFGGNQGFSGFQQGGYGGFGGGFNPMQGGYGGGQMQNPFMSGMGFGGGYDGGMGFGGQPQRQMVSDMGNNTRGGFGGQPQRRIIPEPVADTVQPMNYGKGPYGGFAPANDAPITDQYRPAVQPRPVEQPDVSKPYMPYLQDPVGVEAGLFGNYGGQPQTPMYGLGDSRGPNSSLGGNYDGRNSMSAPANGFGNIGQDQEFLGYQKQNEDLTRQMNEYMQKAPMYQQLQDLQGKMQGVQRRYAPQAPMYQQQPQQRGQYQNFNSMQQPQQQFGGLAALFGGLGGMGRMGRMPQQGAYEQYVDNNNRDLASATHQVKQPTMSRSDFDAREQQLEQRLRSRRLQPFPQTNQRFGE